MPETPTKQFTMVPARRSDEPTATKRARRILRTLWAAAGLSVLAILFSLSRDTEAPDLSTVNPQGRSLAEAAARDFLAGRVQRVPHAVSFKPDEASAESPTSPGSPFPYEALTWTGYSPEKFGSKSLGYSSFEIHHFLVLPSAPTPTPGGDASPSVAASPKPTHKRPGSGTSPSTTPSAPGTQPSLTPAPGETTPGTTPQAPQPISLDVPVMLTPRGPRLAAAPSFGIWNQADSANAGAGDYTNFQNLRVNPPGQVLVQVGRWATAYATNDGEALRTLTGDQNPGHRYMGLGGFTVPNDSGAVQVLSALRSTQNRIIARVRILLVRPRVSQTVPSNKTPEAGNGTAGDFRSYLDFDLLIADPYAAQPPIQAWGPAGSAAELEPYHNALRA
jgi:hypothetical protein